MESNNRKDSNEICIVNPNSNQAMTDALEELVEGMGYENIKFTFITATSSSPFSINNLEDAQHSVSPTVEAIDRKKRAHAYLIACYSPHPLVTHLKDAFPIGIPVLGIMEASLQAAVNLCGVKLDHNESGKPELVDHRFCIITTGAPWKAIFDNAIEDDYGGTIAGHYAGTFAIGVDAGDLHGEEPGTMSVEDKVKDAVRRALLQFGDPIVDVLILGCAGMAGMGKWVREEANRLGQNVHIVDGVKVGVGMLETYLRHVE